MFDIQEGPVFVVHQLSSELGTLLRVHSHGVLKQSSLIRSENDLLGIQRDFLGLNSICKASDDLFREVGPKIDEKNESRIAETGDITHFLGALELKWRRIE